MRLGNFNTHKKIKGFTYGMNSFRKNTALWKAPVKSILYCYDFVHITYFDYTFLKMVQTVRTIRDNSKVFQRSIYLPCINRINVRRIFYTQRFSIAPALIGYIPKVGFRKTLGRKK